jgi:hypothetical protein
MLGDYGYNISINTGPLLAYSHESYVRLHSASILRPQIVTFASQSRHPAELEQALLYQNHINISLSW